MTDTRRYRPTTPLDDVRTTARRAIETAQAWVDMHDLDGEFRVTSVWQSGNTTSIRGRVPGYFIQGHRVGEDIARLLDRDADVAATRLSDGGLTLTVVLP